MGEHGDKWLESMIKKHGSEAAVRRFMSESAKKAKRTGTGGFKYLAANDPDKLRAIASQGGKLSSRRKSDG